MNTTLRLAFLGLIILVAFIIVFPTARHYLQQRQQIAALRQQVNAATQQVSDSQAQLKRWDDPAYVEAQARSRLMYVLPGETPFRVVDPQSIATASPSASATPSAQGTHVVGSASGATAGNGAIPWYDAMWQSTRIVSQAKAPLVSATPGVSSPASPATSTSTKASTSATAKSTPKK